MKKNNDSNNQVAASGPSGLNAFLDQGSEFDGKLTFKGAVRIDGKFTGNIFSQDTLHIGKTGEIDGTVQVGEAMISGTVTGRLECTGRVHFHSTAVFSGELTTAALVVEEGATLDAQIAMTGAKHRKLEEAVESTLTGA